MTEKEERIIISVLLTRYYSGFANFIYWLSGRGYTHASIALDKTEDVYYSFNFNGFCREYPKRQKRRRGKSVCYHLEVTLESYQKIKDRIEDIEETQEEWYYNRMGVFLCLLRIPLRRQKHFFCSEFVAEMLLLSENIFLKRRPSLYLPNQLNFELKQQVCLKEIVYNPI